MMNRLLFAAVTLVAAGAALGAERKFINFGWEFQEKSARDLLSIADKFAEQPFDGVGLYLYGRNPDGKAVSCYGICGEPRWTDEAFASQVPDYRELVSKPGFRDSFLVSYRAPIRRLDWTDDDGWATIAHNMGVLARFAKATGIKGFSVDHEDYRKQRQYYRTEADPPFETCRRLARKRGREVFGAAFREKEDLIVLSFWLLTEDRTYFTVKDPEALRDVKQDLWPDFVAGILDALPAKGRLIEGDEHAYRYEWSGREFQQGRANAVTLGVRLLPPERRATYLSRVEQSFGQYFDIYVNAFDPAKRALWSFGPEDGSRLEHFRRNLEDAVSFAGEYVWFWGEMHPTVAYPESLRPHKRIRYGSTWADELPGLNEMLATVKAGDRGEWLRAKRKFAAGELANLLPPDLKLSTWQAESGKSAGTFAQEGGTATMRNMTDGCFLTERGGLRPGEKYAFTVKAKGGEPSVSAVWMDALGPRHGDPKSVFVFGQPDAEGWRQGRVLGAVPIGADRVRLTLGTSKPGAETSFKSLKMVKLW